MQLGLRVLVVERQVAAREAESPAGAIQVVGELAGPRRSRRSVQQPVGDRVRPFRGGQQPLHRGSPGELPLRKPGRTPRSTLERVLQEVLADLAVQVVEGQRVPSTGK